MNAKVTLKVSEAEIFADFPDFIFQANPKAWAPCSAWWRWISWTLSLAAKATSQPNDVKSQPMLKGDV